jgi:hypothetical protein
MAEAHTVEQKAFSPATCFSLLALVLLGTRFVQGFIFWGGASRRLFYNFAEVNGVEVAAKLGFESTRFMANKLTHALPGTLWIQSPLEMDSAISRLAHCLGLDLDAGRARGGPMLDLNIALMLIFGWMGSTCLDKWTMAVSGVAMRSAVFLAGGGAWSLDSLIGRSGWVKRSGWAVWVFSGPLPSSTTRTLALLLARRWQSCSRSAAITFCSVR